MKLKKNENLESSLVHTVQTDEVHLKIWLTQIRVYQTFASDEGSYARAAEYCITFERNGNCQLPELDGWTFAGIKSALEEAESWMAEHPIPDEIFEPVPFDHDVWADSDIPPFLLSTPNRTTEELD